MRRRELITLLGGVTAAWPLTAHAQQAERIRPIGVLMALSESDPEFLRSRIAGGTPEARMDGRPQHPNRHSLADTLRPGLDTTIRKGARRTAARPHSFVRHSPHGDFAA